METTDFSRAVTVALVLRVPLVQILAFLTLPFAISVAYPSAIETAIVCAMATAVSATFFLVNEESRWKYLWVPPVVVYLVVTMVLALLIFGANPLS